MTKTRTGIVLSLLLLSAWAGAAAAAGAEEGRVAFYAACSETDPGVRFGRMVSFLETDPDGPWADRVRTFLFGVVASEGWKESAKPPSLRSVASAVERETEPYLAEERSADRVLLVAEAVLRAGVGGEEAISLAREGGALARSAERPEAIPLSSWGQMKKERIARSHYLLGLALAASGRAEEGARSFQKAQTVFSNDSRFREEYAAVLAEAGGSPPEVVADEQTFAMEAIGAEDPAEKIAKLEEYHHRFPGGRFATEISLHLVEAYAKSKNQKEKAAAVAEEVARETSDPEVLSALAFVLSQEGVGTETAVRLGMKAKETLEGLIRDPATEAGDFPLLHKDLLMVRDSYGWALLKDGRTTDAVRELKAASETGYGEVNYHYGVALLEAGQAFDAVDPLVQAHVDGVDEAWPYLERLRGSGSGMEKHVDDRLGRAEENWKRRKLGEEEGWTTPDFSLVSLEGDVVRLSDLAGHVVVLDV